MPCRDDRDNEPCVVYKDTPATLEKVDSLTDMLCRLCRKLIKVDHDEFITSDVKLANWWVKHEAWDKKREEAERKVAEKASKKQAALNKLTAEDKKLLGL